MVKISFSTKIKMLALAGVAFGSANVMAMDYDDGNATFSRGTSYKLNVVLNIVCFLKDGAGESANSLSTRPNVKLDFTDCNGPREGVFKKMSDNLPNFSTCTHLIIRGFNESGLGLNAWSNMFDFIGKKASQLETLSIENPLGAPISSQDLSALNGLRHLKVMRRTGLTDDAPLPILRKESTVATHFSDQELLDEAQKKDTKRVDAKAPEEAFPRVRFLSTSSQIKKDCVK